MVTIWVSKESTLSSSITTDRFALFLSSSRYRPPFSRQGQVPFANIGLSKAALASDLAYDVIVDLIVPASTKNLDLGKHKYKGAGLF